MRTRFAILFALSACGLWAASQDEFKRDCAAFKSEPGLNTFKSCATDLFTLKPVHPTVMSIVPGATVRWVTRRMGWFVRNWG